VAVAPPTSDSFISAVRAAAQQQAEASENGASPRQESFLDSIRAAARANRDDPKTKGKSK
jgi:hypothetical protein